jgi:hypothetical protein
MLEKLCKFISMSINSNKTKAPRAEIPKRQKHQPNQNVVAANNHIFAPTILSKNTKQ